jgi:hypothetical protein
MDERYWPFPTLKSEADWTDFDREYVDFMRRAYAEGFRPREAPCISVEAESASGRFISLVWRGRRNGWEPFMADGGRSVRLGPVYDLPLGETACVCIRPPFRAAAHFALDWLRGTDLASIVAAYEFVGGRPSGIALRSPLAEPASSAHTGVA